MEPRRYGDPSAPWEYWDWRQGRGRIGMAGAAALALPILLFAAGCAGPPPTRTDVTRPVKTMVVTAGDELHVRVFSGKVEASRAVELAFQVPGLIVSIPVREGQKVSKGELIAQVRPDEFEARLKTLQGQLDQARAVLKALRAGDRPEQRLRLEAQARAAEAKLANARAEFERSLRLVRTNAIPRSEFELAETAYRVAQEEHKAALQSLEKGTIAREEDIEAQEAAIRGLEGRVVEAKIQLDDTTLNTFVIVPVPATPPAAQPRARRLWSAALRSRLSNPRSSRQTRDSPSGPLRSRARTPTIARVSCCTSRTQPTRSLHLKSLLSQ